MTPRDAANSRVVQETRERGCEFMYNGLDHLAILVADTEAALELWRDRFGFPVVLSEVVNDGTIRLTHLDLWEYPSTVGAAPQPGPSPVALDREKR